MRIFREEMQSAYWMVFLFFIAGGAYRWLSDSPNLLLVIIIGICLLLVLVVGVANALASLMYRLHNERREPYNHLDD